MANLVKTDIITIPDAMIVGYEVVNGVGQNQVPALWEKIFQENLLAQLPIEQAILDLYIGWMGEYLKDSGTFTYIAGLLMPTGYSIPEDFSYRRIASCQVGLGTINCCFAGGEVFEQAHNMTVKGIRVVGFIPDYSFGWSAEAYPKDLSFDAKNGTIHYICPCKKENFL
ncbi:GyrI-like domain-containing protein [Candidatus Enterococcus murrayae]|uniref:GyrI-like domain-containing protein n=1 Tax=Candidatus Enterococcus murrayae TaxID=2815321 RepID=A0ABS3HK21_9ENTE|nr:GyrI-like domain-containing protein [Enterococcus sp. MJM16]MBO0453240.1 GyrI-like domain-containing protein [Enterococcus sp. MJM16]